MLFEIMKKATEKITREILNHPFNQGLFSGSLPKETFHFFLEQDGLYLRDFSTALKITAQQLSNKELALKLREFSEKALEAEKELHTKYLNNKKSHGFFHLQKKPISIVSEYTAHLLETANSADPEIAVSAVSPCFWLYNELGKAMKSSLKIPNVYQDWIDTYTDPHFTKSTKFIIQTVNEFGRAASPNKKTQMIDAFVKSTECELAFFDDVYFRPMKENSLENFKVGRIIPRSSL